MNVPVSRIRLLTDAAPRSDGDYVLYWMIAHRRTGWNFALDRAVECANELGKPLLIFEPLRIGYTYASARFHRFVLDGMRDNFAAIRARDPRPGHEQADDPVPYAKGDGVSYLPYVEPASGAGKGLLATLAERAATVVTDDAPHFHYPAMLDAAARQIGIRFEAVDSNGLWPMRASEKVFHRAFDFRRHLQKSLAPDLEERPAAVPLNALAAKRAAVVPEAVLRRWPPPESALLEGDPQALDALPIDHHVAAVDLAGGASAGTERLITFAAHRLGEYGTARNHPDAHMTSGLSPYLHFGHVGAHQVFEVIIAQEQWDLSQLGDDTSGKRSGWWGMSEDAEAFLDQLVTWRELGFNACVMRNDVTSFSSLPAWARKTMREHGSDKRPHLYTPEQLEQADTHDPIWNAAQRQLVQDGIIHNYLRMLWGKKVYEWSPDGRKALSTMLHLNDKYAVDGRDPNSLSGIFWVLGRYDRAWGPERPVFGKLRYMTSASTQRKVRLAEYLERYGGDTSAGGF